MRQPEEIITHTWRTERQIYEDIERETAFLRVCWGFGNGQGTLIEARLDKLWAEVRAARSRARQHSRFRGRLTLWEERNGEKADT